MPDGACFSKKWKFSQLALRFHPCPSVLRERQPLTTIISLPQASQMFSKTVCVAKMKKWFITG